MLFFRAHASLEIYLDYYLTNLMRNRILSSVWSMFLLILSGKGKLHWNVFINQPFQIIRYWKPYFRNKCLHSWFSFFLQPWLTHLFNTEWVSMISRLINLRDMRRSQIIQISFSQPTPLWRWRLGRILQRKMKTVCCYSCTPYSTEWTTWPIWWDIGVQVPRHLYSGWNPSSLWEIFSREGQIYFQTRHCWNWKMQLTHRKWIGCHLNTTNLLMTFI